jgi:hypothetical protein
MIALSQLCLKMGIPLSLGEILNMKVKTYQTLLVAISALQEKIVIQREQAEAKQKLQSEQT